MEMNPILLWVAIAIADLAFGVFIAAPHYSKRIEKLERKLKKQRSGEFVEFNVWREVGWSLLSLVAWWFVYPYEWLTRWKHWTYPHCTHGWLFTGLSD